jgi:hypothetical protein
MCRGAAPLLYSKRKSFSFDLLFCLFFYCELIQQQNKWPTDNQLGKRFIHTVFEWFQFRFLPQSILLDHFKLFSLGRLSASAPPAAAPSAASSSYPTAAADGADEPKNKRLVQGILSFFNLGFMVFLAATGALGVGSADNINDTGTIFVGIYMIVFAAVVFIFEMSQLCPGTSLDNLMKRNFGFLYGINGKGLFILL